MVKTKLRHKPTTPAKACCFRLALEDYNLIGELAEKHYNGEKSLLFREAIKNFIPTLIDH